MSHDSSRFYGSRLYSSLSRGVNSEFGEKTLDEGSANGIFCKSSERMDELPDRSVHLMVTSPPYNVGKRYDEDLTPGEYLEQPWGYPGKISSVLRTFSSEIT